MQLLSSIVVLSTILFVQNSRAAPRPQLSYVAFGIDGEVPEPLNPDPSATEWVVPIGTDAAGDKTTYLFNEVATLVTDGPSGTITTHTTETGTLVASASGFTLSVITTNFQGLKGAEAECHYTAADSGICVQNLHGEGDLLTLSFGGSAKTHTLPILTVSPTVTAA